MPQRSRRSVEEPPRDALAFLLGDARPSVIVINTTAWLREWWWRAPLSGLVLCGFNGALGTKAASFLEVLRRRWRVPLQVVGDGSPNSERQLQSLSARRLKFDHVQLTSLELESDDPTSRRRFQRWFQRHLAPPRTEAWQLPPPKQPEVGPARAWRRARGRLEAAMDGYELLVPCDPQPFPIRFGRSGRPVLIVEKNAGFRRFIQFPRLAGYTIAASYLPNATACDLVEALREFTSARVAYLGDLDPTGLLGFATLRSGNPDAPNSTSSPRSIERVGVDDDWYRAFGSDAETLEYPMRPQELVALRHVRKLVPDLERLVGVRSLRVLSSGRTTEVEVFARRGIDWIGAQVAERLSRR